GGEGGLDIPPVPRSPDDPRVRGPEPESDPAALPQLAPAHGQDLGPVPVVPVAEAGAATTARAPRRGVPEPPGKRVDLREDRLGKDALAVDARRAVGVAGPDDPVRHVQHVGAGPVGRHTRPQTGTLSEEARVL